MRSIVLATAALVVAVGGAVLFVRSRPPVVAGKEAPQKDAPQDAKPVEKDVPAGQAVAVFGNGCFWCTEAVFLQLKGVKSVTSGYSGGASKNPTYQEICTGLTGHAEVVRVVYDPAIVSYKDLLEAFWLGHDPTTLNRQGADVGTQYRSVIFYADAEQKKLAEESKLKLDKAKAYPDPIVTEISPLGAFYPAENYHQDYFALHGREPYCEVVIRPKLEKVRAALRDKLK